MISRKSESSVKSRTFLVLPEELLVGLEHGVEAGHAAYEVQGVYQVKYSTVQYSTVQYSTVQHSTVPMKSRA